MLCTFCGKPIPPELEPHWDHEEGCSNRNGLGSCWCDLPSCPKHCSVCNEEVA